MMLFNPELVDDSDMVPDAQRGFRFYLTSSNDRGARSLQATSNALDVSLNTVREWSRRYTWAQLAKHLDQANDDESLMVALSRVARARPRIVDRLLEIMDDPKVKTGDQLNAIDQLRDIAGMKRTAPAMVVNLPEASGSSLDPAALAQLSPAQLLALLRGGDPLSAPSRPLTLDAGPALPPPPDSDPLP